MSITETIYEDAAAIGRFRAWIGLIAACVIGFILFIAGIAKLFSGKTKQSVSGTIKTVSCTLTNTMYECNAMITYMVNGNGYNTNVVLTSKTPYTPGQTLSIYVNPSDPNDVSAIPDISGWYFIMGAFFIILIGYAILWVSQKYKFFAAAEGVGTAGSVIRNMW
jgi:hypothetical protein